MNFDEKLCCLQAKEMKLHEFAMQTIQLRRGSLPRALCILERERRASERLLPHGVDELFSNFGLIAAKELIKDLSKHLLVFEPEGPAGNPVYDRVDGA